MQRNGHTNNHTVHTITATPQELTQEVLGYSLHTGPGLRRVMWVLALLFVLGVVGLIIRLAGGIEDRIKWGYTAAIVSFLLTTGQSAVLISVGLRLARGHWRRPLSRAAELFAVVGVLNTLLLIPLLVVLPGAEGRSTIWLVSTWREGWPIGAPVLWDFLAMLFLAICGLGLLYAGAIPDLAAGRDHATGWRKGLCTRLALSWQGTKRQWAVLKAAMAVLGAFYFMFLVFTHTLIASDLALGLVPGWMDSIIPPFHALSGIQSGIATVIIALFFLRNFGGMKEYITVEQFWSLGKLLLALCLLWAYFWWAGFLTFWYGRAPSERAILELLIFGPYFAIFILIFLLNFLVPAFGLMVWNPIRKSVVGPTLAATSVLVGTFFDRIRLFVSAFSVKDSSGHILDPVPPTHYPDGVDVLIIIGALAGAILLYLLASRVIPFLNIWEMQELLILRKVRRFLRRDVIVLGKPE